MNDADKGRIAAEYDMFIGYSKGSNKVAGRLFEILSYADKVKIYIHGDIPDVFDDTPAIAAQSKLLLFVASGNIRTDKQGEPISLITREEFRRFWEQDEKDGMARVFAYDGLDDVQAKKLHAMFGGVENFNAHSGGDDLKKAIFDMLRWVRTSLNKPHDYFDETIEHFFGKNGKYSGRKQVRRPAMLDLYEEQEDEDSEPYAGIDYIFLQALKYCIASKAVSVSMIQRRFPIGYIKACRIVDWMEKMNYITSSDDPKSRRVLITMEEFIAKFGDIDD